MTRQEVLKKVVEYLGGQQALVAYMNEHGVDTDQENPPKIGEVLGDYHPAGGITVAGYEAGRYWDTNNSAQMKRPEKWAPIPNFEEED